LNAGTRRGWPAAGGGRRQSPDQQRDERRREQTLQLAGQGLARAGGSSRCKLAERHGRLEIARPATQGGGKHGGQRRRGIAGPRRRICELLEGAGERTARTSWWRGGGPLGRGGEKTGYGENGGRGRVGSESSAGWGSGTEYVIRYQGSQ